MKDNKYDIIDIYIGRQLKQARKQKHLTLEQVGNYINVKKNTYYYYEQGRTSLPISTLTKICDYLGLNVATVIDDSVKAVYGNNN